MATEQPPLQCEQCGKPVLPSDSYRVLTEVDVETGEPMDIPAKVVHSDCWDEWVSAPN